MTNDRLRRPGRFASLLMAAALGMSMAGCAVTGGVERSEAQDQKPPSAEELLAAGDEAARRGDLQRALAHYLQAVRMEETADAWLRIGAVSTQLGNSERALHAYLKVIELDPMQADSLEGAGLEYLALGDSDAARSYLERALSIDAKRWRSHNALGVLADQANNHESAISHYEAALQINPSSAVLLNNIGYSRYLANELDQAARDLYAATEADPTHARAWSNLALVYAHRGWYADAVQTLSKVTDRPAAYNDIGYIAYRRGDLEEADQLLSEAIRISPIYYATAHQNLELVRAEMGGRQELSSAQREQLRGQISRSSAYLLADETAHE